MLLIDESLRCNVNSTRKRALILVSISILLCDFNEPKKYLTSNFE